MNSQEFEFVDEMTHGFNASAVYSVLNVVITSGSRPTSTHHSFFSLFSFPPEGFSVKFHHKIRDTFQKFDLGKFFTFYFYFLDLENFFYFLLNFT